MSESPLLPPPSLAQHISMDPVRSHHASVYSGLGYLDEDGERSPSLHTASEHASMYPSHTPELASLQQDRPQYQYDQHQRNASSDSQHSWYSNTVPPPQAPFAQRRPPPARGMSQASAASSSYTDGLSLSFRLPLDPNLDGGPSASFMGSTSGGHPFLYESSRR